MTTIVYKDGIICSDGQATAGDDFIISYDTEKIVKGKDYKGRDVYIGLAGLLAYKERVLHNVFALIRKDYNDVVSTDKTTAMVVIDKGDDNKPEIYVYHNGGLVEVVEDYCAVGSGTTIATVLLYLGYSAVDAINITCKFDVYSGGTVTAFNIFTGDEL
jgi:ATP-dependent protease HslVU (ClpYQ) peptidase subunit